MNSYQEYQPALAPSYLADPQSLAWSAALGRIKDFQADKTKQGIQQQFPMLAQSDAVAYIGAELGIPQGPSETLATYISSLVNAWGEWELAGSPWGVLGLLNLLGYSTAYLVYTNGYTWGPSSGVTIPNATSPGTPPSFAQKAIWNFAVGGGFDLQGLPTDVVYWEPSTVHPFGQLCVPNPPNGLVYQQTGIGSTSGITQPVWPLIVGNTVADGTGTWKCIGSQDAEPVGQSQGYPDPLGAFWSNYIIVMDGLPPGWTNISNPPTPTSSPSMFEIQTINQVLTLFGSAHATCVGILALSASAQRATYGWPQGRTFLSDAGITGTVMGNVSRWSPNTAYVSNNIVIPTQGNGHWYRCTTPGTSAWHPEPTWPTTTGATVTDGGVTWTCGGPTNNYLFDIGRVVFALPPLN